MAKNYITIHVNPTNLNDVLKGDKPQNTSVGVARIVSDGETELRSIFVGFEKNEDGTYGNTPVTSEKTGNIKLNARPQTPREAAAAGDEELVVTAEMLRDPAVRAALLAKLDAMGATAG